MRLLHKRTIRGALARLVFQGIARGFALNAKRDGSGSEELKLSGLSGGSSMIMRWLGWILDSRNAPSIRPNTRNGRRATASATLTPAGLLQLILNVLKKEHFLLNFTIYFLG